ncbi:unnamed protein product [Prunus armeniaca]
MAISLSSYLKGTLNATPLTPSPAPSPEPTISPYPASPVHSPAPSSDTVIISHQHHPTKVPPHPRPCPYHGSGIPPSSSPTSHPNPTVPPTCAPNGSPYSPSTSPSSQLPPHVLPAPVVSNAPKGSAQDLISPSPSPSLSYVLGAIESIANGDSHVPFRDSKLTMLQQDSFEDDKTKILMVLCASPDPRGNTQDNLHP